MGEELKFILVYNTREESGLCDAQANPHANKLRIADRRVREIIWSALGRLLIDLRLDESHKSPVQAEGAKV